MRYELLLIDDDVIYLKQFGDWAKSKLEIILPSIDFGIGATLKVKQKRAVRVSHRPLSIYQQD